MSPQRVKENRLSLRDFSGKMMMVKARDLAALVLVFADELVCFSL